MRSSRTLCALLLIPVVLSGCSLFKKSTTVDLDPVAARGTEFEVVMGQLHETLVNDALAMIPETDIPLVNESNLSFKGNVGLGTGNTVNFELKGAGKSDYSDSKNPMGETTLTLSGEMADSKAMTTETEGTTTAQTGKGLVEFAIKMVNQKIFFSLLKAEASQNGQELPLALIVGSYLNKWYGLSFAELNSLTQSAGGPGVDLSTSFGRNPNDLLKDFKARLKPALEQVHFWKLEENLPEENGMLRYRVSFDKEAFQAGVIALTRFAMTMPDGTVQEAEFEKAKADIESNFAKEEMELSGILSVDKANIRNFQFEGTGTDAEQAAELKMTNSAERFTLDVTNTSENTDTAASTTTPETMNLVIKRSGENHYQLSLKVPSEQVEVTIKDFKYSDRDMSFDVNVTFGTDVVFRGTMTYATDEAADFTVTEPETFEPIQNLLSGFFGAAMMGGASTTPATVPALPGTPEAMPVE